MSDHTAYPMSEGSPDQVPVCPRHPDRVAYVRCQRCLRPTCPECQRVAAVGVQCVDCVKEGAKTVRTGRTVFGGEVTDGRPLATMTIIGLCIAVFLGQQASPTIDAAVPFAPYLALAEPWRVLTSVFAHGSIMHIGFNMYALWALGGYLESLLGRARFVATYLISALGGTVAYVLMARVPTQAEVAAGGWDGSWVTPVVGASGAVFGLFAVFMVLQRHLGRSAGGMLTVLAINAALPFFLPGIAWQAHLGGLVTGAACAWIIAHFSGRGGTAKPRAQWLGLAVVLAVLIALAIARYAVVPGWALA